MARSVSWFTKDQKRLLVGTAGALLLAALLYTCVADPPGPRTMVHLTFEDSLDNGAALGLTGSARESQIRYAAGQTGKALETLGEGGWIEIQPEEPVTFGGSMEISFDFRRADWTNPYEAGSGSQTMMTLSGRLPDKIVHLSFSIWPGSEPRFVAYVEGHDGTRHRLVARRIPVTLDWHNVLLTFDKKTETVSLFLDDRLADRVSMVPAVYAAGIEVIKFGTWYKKNQAFKGLIDNFMMRDLGR